MPDVALVLGASTGGIGRHVRSLTTLLPEYGWTVHVVCPPETETVFRFGDRGAKVWRWRRLRAAVAGVDVVHAHGLRAAVASGAALTGAAVPLVATWHNAPLGSGARRVLAARAERLAARRATVTVAVSSDLAVRATAAGARDVRLAGVGAPLRAARPEAVASVRAELRAGDRPVVLCVGRLHPQKGLDVLVRAAAAARWRDRRPAPLTVIAGEGPARRALERLIATTGADVRLLGPREDIAELLAVAAVVAIPSRWEARALIAQEAATAGVPIVGTAVGGLPELLGDAAVLVPPEAPGELVDAVLRVVDDAELASQLAARGRDRAAGWPTERDTAGELDRIYREVLT